MIDFLRAQECAIDELRKTNSILVLGDKEKKNLGYENETCIAIGTEFMDITGMVHSITFHLIFPRYFPLVMPKVLLPEKEYEKYNLLPHIEENMGICTFDTELTRTNPNDPAGIAKECLKKAKSIIENGLNGKNHKDYEEEFKSYWEKKYHVNDLVGYDLLCLSDLKLRQSEIKLLKLNKKNLVFQYVLHQNEDHSLRFLAYLESKNVSFEEFPIIYLGEIEISFAPPLHLRNRDVLTLVQKLGLEKQLEFKRFINGPSNLKIVVATIFTLGQPRIIAWKHSKLETSKINGFRKDSLSKYMVLSTFQSNDLVRRISPVNFSPKQKELRSAGINEPIKSYTFLVSGIGSIGSNLIHFLNSFNEVEFKLIDFDFLSLENIGRHFLGYSYVHLNKSIAMRNFLVDKNPFQKVEVKTTSIIDVYFEDKDFLNSSDYLFLTTGNTNTEEFIADAIESEQVNKPLFLIWVEPFLSGGHCLFLYPGSNSYKSYFTEDGLFKFNVVDNYEYINNNPILSVKEAGCQTTFTPYSQSSVTLFLANIFPEIRKIIVNDIKESQVFSWKGNQEYLCKNKIRINKIYDKVSDNKILIHNV